MNIFNSLGSNYTFTKALNTLNILGPRSFPEDLIKLLQKRYQGIPLLFYKGRHAIEYALKIQDPGQIAITGYTCYAVYQAIKQAGWEPIYLDIDPQTLNFTPQNLKQAIKNHPHLKAVMIQNTLGYPAEVKAIAQICQEQQLILIEDLAHSIAAKYGQTEVGTVGDFTILSFSQDKMIDGVSGGALIVRNPKYTPLLKPQPSNLPITQQLRDRWYPMLTQLIRHTYGVGIGKVSHFGLKKLGLLSTPMADQTNLLFQLPNWYCGLILDAFHHLERNLGHRQKIATIYATQLPQSVLSREITEAIPQAACLRFPIFVQNRDSLVKTLTTHGMHLSDIWYDAPIAPKKYLSRTNYTNQCPNAERVSQQIVNLPTHQNISEKTAQQIAERINQWLKSS